MPRVLRIDTRPPSFDSVVDADFASEIPGQVDAGVELVDWVALTPPPAASRPSLAFVDGVQRLEVRISAEGDGWPLAGGLMGYAAGAVCVAARNDPLDRMRPPLGICHVEIGRSIVITGGADPEPVQLQASNGPVEYRPHGCASTDPTALAETLSGLRADLEIAVVEELLGRDPGLIIVDGRLPPVRKGPVVGFIKTLHQIYISERDQVEVLLGLRTGQRSPLFLLDRPRNRVYSWFICLASPGPAGVGLSGLARLEIDDAVGLAEAQRVADLTAAILPEYASTPERDPRAPQNLLPVGQLEKELRHRLGDLEYLKRLMFSHFAAHEPAWSLGATRSANGTHELRVAG